VVSRTATLPRPAFRRSRSRSGTAAWVSSDEQRWVSSRER
jgi:hypothetical protein